MGLLWAHMSPYVTLGPPRGVKEWSDEVGAMVIYVQEVKIYKCTKFQANRTGEHFPRVLGDVLTNSEKIISHPAFGKCSPVDLPETWHHF